MSSGISVAPWFLSETCRCRDFSLAAMRKYPAQIQSMRCYAQQQGYDLWLLNGSFPRCVACPGSIPSFLSMSLCGQCMYHAYSGALPSECVEVLKVIVTWSLQVPQRFLLFEALLGSRASGNPARTVGNPWWTKHLSKSCDCKLRVSIKS